MSLWHVLKDGILEPDMDILLPSANLKNQYNRQTPVREPGYLAKALALVVVAVGLIVWPSPPTALVAGFLFAFFIGNPLAKWTHRSTKWLLQICVVVLGFGMNLPSVLRLGLHGALFAAATIGATLVLGRWLGRKLALGQKTSMLIAAGTAICGGSAIAAVSAVIGAEEEEIAVSIGTVFFLNAVALYIFPAIGHVLNLSQAQFGLWAGVAIQDISSVVGAGLSYGPGAVQTAIAVKLSRTLWIVPLTLALALRPAALKSPGMGTQFAVPTDRTKIAVPWFIGFFLLASLLRSYVPAISDWSPQLSEIARRGMSLVLFLIGTSLSLDSLRVVGGRTIVTGLILWLFISGASLTAIYFSHFNL